MDLHAALDKLSGGQRDRNVRALRAAFLATDKDGRERVMSARVGHDQRVLRVYQTKPLVWTRQPDGHGINLPAKNSAVRVSMIPKAREAEFIREHNMMEQIRQDRQTVAP